MISPIDTGRYGSEEMRALFTDNARYTLFVRVEAALAAVQGRYGLIPRPAAAAIAACAREATNSLARVRVIEAGTRHELFAVVQEFAERCGPYGRYVHQGATSSDVLDTALSLQLKSALAILDGRLRTLVQVTLAAIDRHGHHIIIARTHGQHALPITLGFKLAVWLDQLRRAVERLDQLRPRVVAGKIAGAVGSLASFGPQGLGIQEDVLRELGLPPAEISAQAVSRDRLAELIGWAALTAATLETMATEVRNLQRTEIDELREPFAAGGQIGSSAMPHKRNPVLCENVCSLSRLVRSLVVPALENVVTWHERDLANSANERFLIPEACILLEEMLLKMTQVLRGVEVNADAMARNLERSRQLLLSERLLLELVDRGMDRLSAYRALQAAASVARETSGDLLEVLAAHGSLDGFLGQDELGRIATTAMDVGRCQELVAAAVARAEPLLERPSREGECP